MGKFLDVGGSRPYRLPFSLAALAVWTALTLAGSFWLQRPTPIVETISRGIAWPIASAAAFLTVLAALLRWRDLGLSRPRPWSSLRVLAAPSLFLVAFACVAVAVGLPPLAVLGFLALNTILVGYSEELMFRGVLFQGFLTRMGMRSAVWATSAAFGTVHLLNAITTGDLPSAAIQAVGAFMAGTFLMAVVLRTRSIVPAMVYHALWDVLLTAAAAGGSSASDAAAPAPDLPTAALLLPLVLDLPNFVYALYLLRNVEHDGAPRAI